MKMIISSRLSIVDRDTCCTCSVNVDLEAASALTSFSRYSSATSALSYMGFPPACHIKRRLQKTGEAVGNLPLTL